MFYEQIAGGELQDDGQGSPSSWFYRRAAKGKSCLLSPQHTTTVLIADDHEMTRKGIRAFLEQSPDIDVIGEAGDGDQLKELVTHLHP